MTSDHDRARECGEMPIHDAISYATTMYRKGSVVRDKAGAVRVITIDAMPPATAVPASVTTVDVHFFVCGVEPTRAEEVRPVVIDWLNHYPEPDRLAGGPSYIEFAGVLGDQGATLCLYALGEVLGLWRVITPERLGMGGEMADSLAGSGFVMIEGYNKA